MAVSSSSEDSFPRRDWGDLGGAVATCLGLQTLRSPTLRDMIQHGMRYVDVSRNRQLVFDTRAGIVGMLLAAQPDLKQTQYETSATWLYNWLSQRVSSVSEMLNRARSNPEQILSSFREGFEVRLSASMNEIMKLAEGISQATLNTPLFEARHFLVAMVMHGGVKKIALQLFKLDLDAEDVTDLKLYLVHNILRTGNGAETPARWHRVLGLPPPGGEQGGSDEKTGATEGAGAVAVGDQMEVVIADRVDISRDTLNTKSDAKALARVLCLYDAAPLALAVFGAWGSGKSTFMARLDAEIKELASGIMDDPKVLTAAPAGAAKFINRVVQIKFNAWQFADANLWASLTAEFFDQLRAGGWDRVGGVRHSELVERVGRHVHSLNDEVEAKREAASRGGKDLRVAQQKRDEAAESLDSIEAKVLTQASVDLLGDIYEAEKPRLSALGLAVTGKDAGKAADVVIAAVAKSRSISDQIDAIEKVLQKTPERGRPTMWALLLFVLIAVTAVVVWFFWKSEILQWPALVASVVTGVTAIGAAANWLGPVLSLVSSVTRRGADIARAVELARDEKTKDLLQAELGLRKAAVEAKALKDAADQAQQRLSRYVDPGGSANPPRLLRYVLEDDPNTKALQAEVGLIGRTRRLFEAVNQIIEDEKDPVKKKIADDAKAAAARKGVSPAPEEPKPAAQTGKPDRQVKAEKNKRKGADVHKTAQTGSAGEKTPADEQKKPEESQSSVPERIIIYIDDLDRCNEQQVYNVLQAIHLLLAFPAFVVVVGVDVDWVHGALAKSIARDDDDGPKKKQRASRYLEKIFQLAFWLRPLSSEANGSFAGYVRALAEPAGSGAGVGVLPIGPLTPTETKTEGGVILEAAKGLDTPVLGLDAPLRTPTEASTKDAAIQLLKTIQLEKIEIDFLASQAMASIAATTPRAVKRLMNVYRIVRARLSDAGYAITGTVPDKALYPLIALSAAIETGQPAEVANSFFEGLGRLSPAEALFQFTKAPPPAPKAKEGEKEPPVDPLQKALRDAPAIRTALAAVILARGGGLSAGDLQSVLQLTRRYSFNHDEMGGT